MTPKKANKQRKVVRTPVFANCISVHCTAPNRLSGWSVIMHSLSCSISHLTPALAVAVALLSTCLAQEIASVDLTKIEGRVDLRRPRASSPMAGGYNGIQQTESCFNSARYAGALRVSVVSLDRTHYQVGDA